MPQEAFEVVAVPAAEAAKLLSVSERHLWSMHSTGRLGPLPIRLGRSVRWRKSELLAWLEAGTPERTEWQQRRTAG